MRTLAVALLLALAACGTGSAEEEPPPAKPSVTAATPTASPTPKPPTGTPAPEALSRFRCSETSKGWKASGHLANTTKSAVTYQVTVFVGEAAGAEEKARTRQVANVAAGGSVTWRLVRIPAPEDGGTCHVQVLAVSK